MVRDRLSRMSHDEKYYEQLERYADALFADLQKANKRWERLKTILRRQQDMSGGDCLCYDFIENQMIDLETE